MKDKKEKKIKEDKKKIAQIAEKKAAQIAEKKKEENKKQELQKKTEAENQATVENKFIESGKKAFEKDKQQLEEVDENSEYENSGDDNLGDENSGDDNSGDDNSGDNNSGDDNSGDNNSGDDNSGDDNSGEENNEENNEEKNKDENNEEEKKDKKKYLKHYKKWRINEMEKYPKKAKNKCDCDGCKLARGYYQDVGEEYVANITACSNLFNSEQSSKENSSDYDNFGPTKGTLNHRLKCHHEVSGNMWDRRVSKATKIQKYPCPPIFKNNEGELMGWSTKGHPDYRFRNKNTLQPIKDGKHDVNKDILLSDISGKNIYNYFFRCDEKDTLHECLKKTKAARRCYRCRKYNSNHLGSENAAGEEHKPQLKHLEEILGNNNAIFRNVQEEYFL